MFVLKCGGGYAKYTTYSVKANPAVCNVVSVEISAALSGSPLQKFLSACPANCFQPYKAVGATMACIAMAI